MEHPCSPDGDDIGLRETAPACRLGCQFGDPTGVAEQIGRLEVGKVGDGPTGVVELLF
jgi:hypothetical protein